ncbi:MAG: hypothetical protein L3K26_18615, partial [Candidatus Hydrogenedentes bacterium]|nr:hypothetical protein [Candidatus Hydrogenedentota bacterium]
MWRLDRVPSPGSRTSETPMRSTSLGAIALLAVVGCTSEEGDDTAALGPMITGTIQPDGEDVSGYVEGQRAFAFDASGIFLAYISPNVNATCENVTAYLQTGVDPYDPVEVL